MWQHDGSAADNPRSVKAENVLQPIPKKLGLRGFGRVLACNGEKTRAFFLAVWCPIRSQESKQLGPLCSRNRAAAYLDDSLVY